MPRPQNPTGQLTVTVIKKDFGAAIKLLKAPMVMLDENMDPILSDGKHIDLDEDGTVDRVLMVRAYRDDTHAICAELNTLLKQGKEILDGIAMNQKKLGLKGK